MLLQSIDPMPVVWTVVPRGVIEESGRTILRLMIIMAPNVRPNDLAATGIGTHLFSDWPRLIKQMPSVLDPFTVTFENNTGTQITPLTGEIDASGIVNAGIWPNVFGTLAARTRVPLSSDDLPVDSRALSYDAHTIHKKLRFRRGLDMCRTGARAILDVERDDELLLTRIQANVLFYQQKEMAQLVWSPRPEAWAEIKLDVDPDAVPDNQDVELSDERRRMLEDRNLYRLASDPRTQLRDDAKALIAKLTKAGGSNCSVNKSALKAAPEAFAELALFHSRVPPLVPKTFPLQEDFDFPEIIGMIRNYPYLAKRLGLILTVRVTPTEDQLTQLSSDRWRVWVKANWHGSFMGAPLSDYVNNFYPSTWCDINPTARQFVASEVIPDAEHGLIDDENHRSGYLVLDPEKWELATCDIDGAANKQLQEAESAVARMPPAIITNIEGRILAANEIANKLMSRSASPIIEKKIEDLIPAAFPELQQPLRRVLKELFDEGIPGKTRTFEWKIDNTSAGDLRPDTCNFLITLRCQPERKSMRCEWIGQLDAYADARPFQELIVPAQRTVGLALLRRDAGVDLAKTANRQIANTEESAAKTDGSPQLGASDLILGYVPEVWAPPAQNANGAPRWHSTTMRQETYPALQEAPRIGEGFVALGMAVTEDAAGGDQTEPPRQGTASPPLFVYNNESLGFPAQKQSGDPAEDGETPQPTPSPDKIIAKLERVSHSLPLVRYSHASSSPFEYRVRCRYVDITGKSFPRSTADFDPSSELELSTRVLRQEPVDPPRVLLREQLDLRENPGAGLRRMVVTESWPHTVRIFIPPKTTSDRVLRYGFAFGNRLGAHGGFRSIGLTEHAEVPVAPILNTGEEEPPELPIYRANGARIEDGFYYLPDPGCLGVAISVLTFYAAAYEQAPIVRTIPFYDRRWPAARPIAIRLSRLEVGAVEPIVTANKRSKTFEIRLPPAWTAQVKITSITRDGTTRWPADHFAAASDLDFFEFALKAEMEKLTAKRKSSDRDANSFRHLEPLMQQCDVLFRSKDNRASQLMARDIELGNNPITTPPEKIDLVCAVRKPLYAPSLHISIVGEERQRDKNTIDLDLTANVDEKSTGEVTVSATWSRQNDDPALEEPVIVQDHVEFTKLKLPSPVYYRPTASKWPATVDLGTTRFRRVNYRISGLTRFTDCYGELPQSQLTAANPTALTFNHPNCSRLHCPEVEFIVPTLTWTAHTNTAADRPTRQFASSAHYGIRVFLRRGWELGELLGVITAPTLSEHQAWALNKGKPVQVEHDEKVPNELENSLTRWGADPVVDSNLFSDLPCPTDFRGFKHVGTNLYLPPFENSDPTSTSDAEASEEDEENTDVRRVSVVGYKPRFDKRRRLWYCDIGLNRIPSYGCFIRMVLARYQPKSLETLELSSPVIADFVQLRPDRIVNIMRDPISPAALRVIIREPSEAKTPMDGGTGAGGVRNKFKVDVFRECAAPHTNMIAWVLDPDRVAIEDTFGPANILWSGRIPWPDYVHRRRLVIREFETWKNGTKEVFSNVLEL